MRRTQCPASDADLVHLVSSARPAGRGVYDVARNAVKQMLRVVLSGYAAVGARLERSEPFADIATAFFTRKSVI
jgi:hypothetical protein